jgi:hypothetical protein
VRSSKLLLDFVTRVGIMNAQNNSEPTILSQNLNDEDQEAPPPRTFWTLSIGVCSGSAVLVM